MTSNFTDTAASYATVATEALEAIRVAAALGMQMEAPAGTLVYDTYVHQKDGSASVPLGLFSSREAALNAAGEWILNEWWADEYMPWKNRCLGEVTSAGRSLQRVASNEEAHDYLNDMELWTNDHTPADVIAMVDDGKGKLRYTIRVVTIK